MSIRDELRTEMEDAMKSGDRAKLAAIRQVESEIAITRSSPDFTGEVDDDLYLDTIATVVRRDEKSRREYAALGPRGEHRVAKLDFEIEYLSGWLPTAMSEDDTRQIVRATIAELGADDPGAAGRVIGTIMKTRDDVDGALVNQLVREELGS